MDAIELSSVDDYKVIDCDCHIIEPYDLWTSRVSSRWGDLVPHVEWNENTRQDVWVGGISAYAAAAGPAMAGFSKWPPARPATLKDAHPATYDVKERLKLMDEHGIWAEVLYPNVGGFGGGSYMQIKEAQLRLECIQAYNDFLIEYGSIAPSRFIANAALPFWDVEASVAELARCHEIGHRGLIFSSFPDRYGQPNIASSHWDPIWAAASERDMPVNFHIGSGGIGDTPSGFDGNPEDINWAIISSGIFTSNVSAILDVILGGVCERFPDLSFVSVESGIGWVPYVLEVMDWQWRSGNLPEKYPSRLLPSEYFRRQWYACFWFERAGLTSAVELLGTDRVLYETDFPHPTSQSPGPASVAVSPRQYISEVMSAFSEETRRKILHENAAALYHC
jgi:uncharacterized protein